MLELVREHIDDLFAVIEEAGEMLLRMYKKQDLEIQMKSDATPVTEADRCSNEIVSKRLKSLFPDIPIISEEANLPEYSIRRKWDYFWLVDPLDGTKEFIYKNGRFCINIALIYKDTPIFGMINNILSEEILWAFKDEKCFIKKENSISELKVDRKEGSKLKMVVSRFNMTELEFKYIDYLQSKGYVLELIPLGASAKHCEIAKGNVDVFPKFGKCYEWDTAAGQVIVESAGGMIVNPESYSNLEYNKENMTNPPFIMFNQKLKELIEGGDDVLIHYK